MEKFYGKEYDVSYDVIENSFNLDVNRIISKNLIMVNNSLYYPIAFNGETNPSNKSEHFLVPIILAKKYIETYHNDVFVYDNVLKCFQIAANGTGRFFEALSKDDSPIQNTIVISGDNFSQGFGQVFAMGLQNVDYIHIPLAVNVDEYIDKNKYDNVVIYINELHDEDVKLFDFIKTNNLQNVKIATILDYTQEKYDFDIISLVKLKINIAAQVDNNSTTIITCRFPNINNRVVAPVIDPYAKQDDNLIELIMTLMSSQDFTKKGDKIKILFVSDENNQYLPMLISEFFSGFDQYDVYFSSISSKDLDIKDKLVIDNAYNRRYLYNITSSEYEFLFYLSLKRINSDSSIFDVFSKLSNIQRKNILVND